MQRAAAARAARAAAAHDGRAHAARRQALPYALPYHDAVPPDPSFDDMHAVVVVAGARPPIPLGWSAEPGSPLAALAALMAQCWHASPPVRLTALRVKKTLARHNVDSTVKLV